MFEFSLKLTNSSVPAKMLGMLRFIGDNNIVIESNICGFMNLCRIKQLCEGK